MRHAIIVMCIGFARMLADGDVPTGAPSWLEDLTAFGLVAFVLWWILTKTIPQMRADYLADQAAAREAFARTLAEITERHAAQERLCHQAIHALTCEVARQQD